MNQLSYVGNWHRERWSSSTMPIIETVKAMENCVDEGDSRFTGVSNVSIPLFKEAQSQLRTR